MNAPRQIFPSFSLSTYIYSTLPSPFFSLLFARTENWAIHSCGRPFRLVSGSPASDRDGRAQLLCYCFCCHTGLLLSPFLFRLSIHLAAYRVSLMVFRKKKWSWWSKGDGSSVSIMVCGRWGSYNRPLKFNKWGVLFPNRTSGVVWCARPCCRRWETRFLATLACTSLRDRRNDLRRLVGSFAVSCRVISHFFTNVISECIH